MSDEKSSFHCIVICLHKKYKIFIHKLNTVYKHNHTFHPKKLKILYYYLRVFVICLVISLLCLQVLDKTCTSPTPLLEQHVLWDDIAILARYLLMLSFNNCLDVARHLPYLFHAVTLLVCSGSLSMRASTHGLVINIIHSLCTCTMPQFTGIYLLNTNVTFIFVIFFSM